MSLSSASVITDPSSEKPERQYIAKALRMIETGQPEDDKDVMISVVHYYAQEYHDFKDPEVCAEIVVKLIRRLKKKPTVFDEEASTRVNLETIKVFLKGRDGRKWSMLLAMPVMKRFD